MSRFKTFLLITFFSVTFYSISYANMSAPLLKSCLTSQVDVSKKQCKCLVKEIQNNVKIKKMFKKTSKKLGVSFKEKILKELSINWWSSSKYKKMPKNRKLNYEENAILVISMNASFACLKSTSKEL